MYIVSSSHSLGDGGVSSNRRTGSPVVLLQMFDFCDEYITDLQAATSGDTIKKRLRVEDSVETGLSIPVRNSLGCGYVPLMLILSLSYGKHELE